MAKFPFFGGRFVGSRKTLLHGTIGAFATDMVGLGLMLLAHALYARTMSSEAYGALNLGLSWVAILSLVACLGLDSASVRYVAEFRIRQDWASYRGLMRTARSTVLLASALVGLCLALCVGLLSTRLGPEVRAVFQVAAVLLPILALAKLETAALRGLKRVVLGRLPLFVIRPSLLVLALSMSYLSSEPEISGRKAMLLYVGAVTGPLLILLILERTLTPPAARSAVPHFEVRRWLKTSLPLFLTSGMRVLLNQGDIVLVGVLLGAREAGIYGIATRLAKLMAFGLMASETIAGPLIAELNVQERRNELQRVASMASWIATATALFIGSLLLFFSDELLGIFGQEFRFGKRVLALLALGHLVNAMTGPVGLLLNLTGHERVNARIFGTVTLLNLLLNVPAILLLGMEGAALVTAALIATNNIGCWVAVRRLIGVNSSILGRGGNPGADG